MPEEGFLSQEPFCSGTGALFLCVSSHLFVLSHFRDFDSLSKDNVYENNRLVSPCYATHRRKKEHENDHMEVM